MVGSIQIVIMQSWTLQLNQDSYTAIFILVGINTVLHGNLKLQTTAVGEASDIVTDVPRPQNGE